MTTIKIAQDRSGEQSGIGSFIAFLSIVPLVLWSGLVLMVLWNWFIPATFRGLPPLTFIQAIGLGLVVEFITLKTNVYVDKSKTALERIIESIAQNVIMGIIFLVIGFIFHFFM